MQNERNEFTKPVVMVVDHHLEYKQTRMGPESPAWSSRRSSPPSTTGRTTRRRSLTDDTCSKLAQVGVESTLTPDGVRSGVTVDGESVTVGTDPLLDAWTDSVGVR
jgi:hypothetical protein